MTTRGLKEEDFRKVAHFVDRAVVIAVKINNELVGKFSCCDNEVFSFRFAKTWRKQS
jgi:hypothetical protein